MKITIGVTLYNPSELILNQIYSYSEFCKYIYIYDNSDELKIRDFNKFFFNKNTNYKNTNFIFLENDSNKGLAVSMNLLCENAIKNNYDFICLLDQDSLFTQTNFLLIKQKIEYFKFENLLDEIAIYCPKIIFNHKQPNINKQPGVSNITWAITSGSFINLKIYSKIGKFDEKLFIDRIDFDYCKRVIKKKYKILQVNNSLLYQELGETKKILFFKISQHNFLRHYYMFRNRLYYYLVKNFNFYSLFIVLYGSLKQIFMIFFEDKSLKKILYISKAISDFKNNKFGKYDDKNI